MVATVAAKGQQCNDTGMKDRHCLLIDVGAKRSKVSRICLRNSRLADWKAITPREVEVVGGRFIPDDNDKGGPHC